MSTSDRYGEVEMVIQIETGVQFWTKIARVAERNARDHELAGNPAAAAESRRLACDTERCARTWDAENEETTE